MSERPWDVLVVGELNVDIIVTGDVVPEFGQVEKIVDDILVCAGASCGIFAAAAAKMGLRVLYSSRVGDDLFGHFMLDALRGAGVDPSHVHVDPALKTGAGILLSRGQDRAILTYLGSIDEVSARDVDPAWYPQARHLHLASPFLLRRLRPHMPEMVRAARGAGMTVSLDPNWDPEERWELDDLLAGVDLFLPNENELLAITGERDVYRALEGMGSRVPVVVAKRGPEGAAAISEGRTWMVPAFRVPLVDTTGAGDTFDGGFLAGWLRGRCIHDCLRLGSASAALGLGQVGGFNGQPTWDEACRFLAALGQPLV